MDTRHTIEVNINKGSSCYAGINSPKTKQILKAKILTPSAWQSHKILGRR